MVLVDEIRIHELRDRHGEVPPRRLRRTLARRDVVLGELLDEELRLLDGFGAERQVTSPTLGIVSRVVAEAVGQVTWVQRRATVPKRTARSDGTVLEDDLDPDEGTHLLALRSGDRGATTLAAVLDPRPDPGEASPHPDAGAPHPVGEVGVAAVSIASCNLTVGPAWGSDRPG